MRLACHWLVRPDKVDDADEEESANGADEDRDDGKDGVRGPCWESIVLQELVVEFL